MLFFLPENVKLSRFRKGEFSMHRIQRFLIALVFVLSFIFLSSTAASAQAMVEYLFLEVVDSNQKPVANAKIEKSIADEYREFDGKNKQTDEKGSATFQYMEPGPGPRLFQYVISKQGYYPFDLFGLLNGTFYEYERSAYRQKLTVELLKIPQNKAEKRLLGNEQAKRDFFSAVLAGDAAKARKLLKSGIDPNISTDDLRGVPRPKGIPAMLYAADNADIETMNAFLAAGINLRKENSNIRNILAFYVGSRASIKNDENIPYAERVNAFNDYVDILIKSGASLDAANAAGQTLLTIAANRGNPALVKKLLERGAPVDAKNKTGLTTLMELSSRGYSPAADNWKTEIINLLLKSGANPNTVVESEYGCDSPLIYAARFGQLDFVKLLLSYKADANLKCRDGSNALNQLSSDSNPNYGALVKILVDAGADVKAAGESGVTPLMTAVDARDIQAVKFLLGKGAPVNAQDKFGRTALIFSILGISKKPDIEIVDLLLKSGADPNLTTNDTTQESFGTALAGAVWYEPLYCVYRWKTTNCWYRSDVQYASEEIIKLLIANKADVNLAFQKKDTPLVSAAKGGRAEAIKLLVEAGANARGEQGSLALKAAKQKMQNAPDKSKFEEIIKLLEAAGAKD